MTYTVTVTVLMGGTQTLLEIYDTNTNPVRSTKTNSEKPSFTSSGGDIDTAQIREVIVLYITG